MAITGEQFGQVAMQLGTALSAAGVPDETVTAIIGAVAPLADEIVAPAG